MTRPSSEKSPSQHDRRIVRALTTAALAAMLSVISVPHMSPALADTPSTTATVLRVVDGDTIDVRDDTRGRLRVRLIGIDAPEVHKPGWSVGCFGPEAMAFAARALTGQRVALTNDPTQDEHDRYGRTLAYIQLADGWDYSIEAARAGMAHSYVYGKHPASRSSEIAAAEQEAQASRRGLWGPPCNGHTESVEV